MIPQRISDQCACLVTPRQALLGTERRLLPAGKIALSCLNYPIARGRGLVFLVYFGSVFYGKEARARVIPCTVHHICNQN